MSKLGSESPRLKIIINLFVLLISLYGVSKKDFTNEQASIFDSFLINSFAPIQRTVVFVKNTVNDFFDHYLFMINASMENQELKKKIMELENKIFQLEELKDENERLKKLLQFGGEIPRTKVLAQIVGWDSSAHFKVLRINKGLKDGIRSLSTVVTYSGLVGHIYRLTDHFADILTILDQNNRVDVIVTRTRSHGIIEGFSNTHCIMKYVTRTEPVANGDLVITAGLGNIYPKGLNVGSISKIERESYGITQLIEVTPSVDFRKLEEVIVLVSPDKEDRLPEIRALNKADEEAQSTGTSQGAHQ